MSWDFIMNWTKSPNQDFSKDRRGWPKGKGRKYNSVDQKRIKKIYEEIKSESQEFFCNASMILQRYCQQYPGAKNISLRFIGTIMNELGLREKRTKKGGNKGAARYLHYPEYSINNLGEKLLEIDFIGKKFIKGRTEPVNFIAFSYKKPQKLKHFKRISGETGDEVIKCCQYFFNRFGKTDVAKIDNDFAFAGSSGKAKRTVSKVPIYFLKKQIIPVFTAPRKPWNQASIEGSNSVFSKKFWKKFEFKNLEEIDEKLKWFNNAYLRFTGYQTPQEKTIRKKNFIPRIYFIRKVYENQQNKTGYIELVNDKVKVKKDYINLFVFAEWNLKEEKLYVYFENEQKLKLIKKISFSMNQRTKEKVSGFIL